MTGLPDQPTDEALMVRYQRGDRHAMTTLVRRHQSALFNFAVRQIGASAVAEEVVQDAFVRVVQSAADFKHEARFVTWVYAILRNLCIDQQRRRAFRRHSSLDQATGDGPPIGEQVEDASASVERNVTGRELSLKIASAVQALPDDQREVFLLREGSNLPFRDIAVITGVPENTVKSRMRYALERLQAALADYEEYAHALK